MSEDAGREWEAARSRYRREKGSKGCMTVAQAGRLGGEKTRDTHDHEYYQRIGAAGGSVVRRLIQAGKKAEEAGKKAEEGEEDAGH